MIAVNPFERLAPVPTVILEVSSDGLKAQDAE
jgi:hypothetical protein